MGTLSGTTTNMFLSLVFLYIIIGSNFLPQLFNCSTQDLLTKSMTAKHILGFVTLLIFVVDVSPGRISKVTPIKQLGLTILIYAWFVLTTRVDRKYFPYIVFCMLSVAFLNMNYRHYRDENTDNPILTFTDNRQVYLKYVRYLQIFFIVVGLLITIYGFGVYSGKVRAELGDGFSWTKFFQGQAYCPETFLDPNDNPEEKKESDWKFFLKNFF